MLLPKFFNCGKAPKNLILVKSFLFFFYFANALIWITFFALSGKGVLEVEGIDLERLYGSNTIEGSNPSLSFNKNVF